MLDAVEIEPFVKMDKKFEEVMFPGSDPICR